MYLTNNGTAPRYCSAANKTLTPGASSRDLDVFEKALRSVERAASGFSVTLSRRDEELLSRILGRSFGGGRPAPAPAYDQRRAASSSVDRVVAARIAKKAETDRLITEAAAREARAAKESNFLDESGNPIEDRTVGMAARESVAPELHPEMAEDLSKVLANNLAVMTTASGKPITSPPGIVAGSTVVSHDPAHYQNRRTGLPPGMPDFGGGAR